MLDQILKDYNFDLCDLKKLNQLREICLEYNKKVNLTSIIDETEFNKKHILDSVSASNFIDFENKKILDFGSGAGFPGLVLAILFKNSNFTLLDSNKKKTDYLKYVVQKLELTNVEIVNSRIEDFPKSEYFDIILARAVAKLSILLELTFNLTKLNGKLVFYKGNNVAQEFPKKWEIIDEKLGLKLLSINDFRLDNNVLRKILIFKKTLIINNNTYPRKFFKIKSTPLF